MLSFQREMQMYQYPSYMYHYGVKGMKWGVRRYRNPDGSQYLQYEYVY